MRCGKSQDFSMVAILFTASNNCESAKGTEVLVAEIFANKSVKKIDKELGSVLEDGVVHSLW